MRCRTLTDDDFGSPVPKTVIALHIGSHGFPLPAAVVAKGVHRLIVGTVAGVVWAAAAAAVRSVHFALTTPHSVKKNGHSAKAATLQCLVIVLKALVAVEV